MADQRKFHRYCKKPIKQRGQMEVLESELRKRTIDSVTADLQREVVKQSTRTQASYFEAEHFS